MSKARSTDALLNDPIDPVGAVVGGDGETDAAEWSLVHRVRWGPPDLRGRKANRDLLVRAYGSCAIAA